MFLSSRTWNCASGAIDDEKNHCLIVFSFSLFLSYKPSSPLVWSSEQSILRYYGCPPCSKPFFKQLPFLHLHPRCCRFMSEKGGGGFWLWNNIHGLWKVGLKRNLHFAGNPPPTNFQMNFNTTAASPALVHISISFFVPIFKLLIIRVRSSGSKLALHIRITLLASMCI